MFDHLPEHKWTTKEDNNKNAIKTERRLKTKLPLCRRSFVGTETNHIVSPFDIFLFLFLSFNAFHLIRCLILKHFSNIVSNTDSIGIVYLHICSIRVIYKTDSSTADLLT